MNGYRTSEGRKGENSSFFCAGGISFFGGMNWLGSFLFEEVPGHFHEEKERTKWDQPLIERRGKVLGD